MSPLGMLATQCHIRLKEQVAESAMFGVAHVTTTMQEVRGVAEVAVIKAAAMRGRVEEKVQEYMSRVKVGTSNTIKEVTQWLE